VPIYVYRDTITNEEFEIFQKMSDDALTIHPENGHPIIKCIIAPNIRTEDNMTIGTLAEKNTNRMIANGDSRIQKKQKNPWWRKDKDKPVNTSKWTKKQKRKYIMEGKHP